jgi:hypothetical protein
MHHILILLDRTELLESLAVLLVQCVVWLEPERFEECPVSFLWIEDIRDTDPRWDSGHALDATTKVLFRKRC